MNRIGKASVSTLLQQAVAHHQAGRFPEAEEFYRQVLQEVPNHPDALNLLGVISLVRGHIDSAISLIGQAISADPSKGSYYFNLGNALQAKGHLDGAVAGYRQAILLKPDYPEAHSNLGNILRSQGHLDEAIACCRRALSIRPDYPEAYNNLGTALKDQDQLDEAIASYRQAILIRPDYADACNNLGAVLQAQNRLDEAVSVYRQALSIRPDNATAHYNLGNALQAQGELEEAAVCYRQALLIQPDFAEVFNNLGIVLLTQGLLDEAIASYRQALHIKPDYLDAYSNLIFTLDLKVGTVTASMQVERRRWSEIYADAMYVTPSLPNQPDPERRLRIGYVSADFRKHSAAVVFGAMLTHFDSAAFDVFAYSNSVVEDEYTRLFQQSVTGWRKIAGLSDDVVARMIRQDGIDILVDLSGHSAANRLLVFARKPAPIQITAWGYVGGTGMKAMDIFLADSVVVPPEEKHLFAEEVRYLPNFVSAFFPEPFPAVNALPALTSKGVTFGSFNRLCKVSAEAYQTWAQVLLMTSDSRMVIKSGELDYPATRDRVLGNFSRAGIDPARITLLGRSTWHAHMQAFHQVDISLDPYPHGGGVTTLEGLMMGVPVVTLRWPTIYGRLSASMLTTLGLTDWIAESPQQYIDIVVQKAQDLTGLSDLRQQLRSRFTTSIIGDTTAYARAVEQEYRTLWREWCLRSGVQMSTTAIGHLQDIPR